MIIDGWRGCVDPHVVYVGGTLWMKGDVDVHMYNANASAGNLLYAPSQTPSLN